MRVLYIVAILLSLVFIVYFVMMCIVFKMFNVHCTAP